MGPLAGLRVIEIASIGPGPLACMLLADLGADVVRVDRLEASGLGVPMAPRFDVNARSRRSVALDLKSRAGINLNLAAKAAAYLEGRDYVLPEDIKEVAPDVMNHRIILNYEAEADNVKTTDIIKAILNKVPIGK